MKLQKFDDLLLNLVVVFEAHRIKGVTPLRAAEATKQLVVHVRCRKISALMLKCGAPVWRSVYSTFAHSIFEGSPSKVGFHGTHGTPSGSATACTCFHSENFFVTCSCCFFFLELHVFRNG